MESVDKAVFTGPSTTEMPNDDECYEADVGMLSGDDGGYTQFGDLEEQENKHSHQQMGVYHLLGCDDEGDGATVDEDGAFKSTRVSSSPKRPRRTPALGLAEEMEAFIRGLRELCEPHRDAAREESEKRRDVPKNIHRKAVSAANVVEELLEMENKARMGRYERVEECISAVSACISNQDETFRDVLGGINARAETLRKLSRERKERLGAIVRVQALTTGILGAESNELDSFNMDDEMDIDENAEAQCADATGNGHQEQPSRQRISYVEANLKCWASNNAHILPELATPVPRLPFFRRAPDVADTNQPNNSTGSAIVQRPQDNLVGIIGLENPVMKHVLGLLRLRQLREIGLSKLQAVSQRKALAGANASLGSSSADGRPRTTQMKTEDMLAPAAKDVNASKLEMSTSPRNKFLKKGSSKRPSSSQDSTMAELEIRNDPFAEVTSDKCAVSRQGMRERALGRSVCALMLSSSGFTHSSSRALDILTDVLEGFVTQLGRSLTSCRENVDREEEPQEGGQDTQRVPSRDQVLEQLKVISSSECRGGFPKLFSYVRSDLVRSEQAIREAEARLRMQIAKIDKIAAETQVGQVPVKLEGSDEQETNEKSKDPAQSDEAETEVSTEEIFLDDAAFTFGYVTNTVLLDILGPFKVPRELALKDSRRVPREHDAAVTPPKTTASKPETGKSQNGSPLGGKQASPMEVGA